MIAVWFRADGIPTEGYDSNRDELKQPVLLAGRAHTTSKTTKESPLGRASKVNYLPQPINAKSPTEPRALEPVQRRLILANLQ